MGLHLTQILVRPLITEKNNLGREERNEIVFEVNKAENKPMITDAVEQLFGVKVEAVRTIHHKGKARRVGKWSGFRPDTKKAVVKLAAGETIDFFKGV